MGSGVRSMSLTLADAARRRIGHSGELMLSNSSYLVLTTMTTAGLGFAFWWIAARRFTPDAVGVAAATVSLMSLLGYVAMLGLGTLLIAEIHRRPGREAPFVSTALTVSALAGLALGVAATMLARRISPELAVVAATPIGAGVFAVGVALTSSTLVLDQALVGLLRAKWQFVRNLVFAAGKLVVLVAAAILLVEASGAAIVGAWVIGIVLSLVPLALIALRSGGDLRRFVPTAGILRHLRSGLLAHHALNLSIQAPSLAMPVLVALTVSAAAAAYFYAAWMIAGFVSIGTSALAMTLFSVGSRRAEDRVHATRLALVVSAALVSVAVVGLALVGPLILGTFGPAYASEAEIALVLLAVAALPGIIKAYFVQVCRFESRLGVGALILSIGAVAELAASAAGAARGGITGVAAGYLIATTAEAFVMAPTVLRSAGLLPRLRGSRPSTGTR